MRGAQGASRHHPKVDLSLLCSDGHFLLNPVLKGRGLRAGEQKHSGGPSPPGRVFSGLSASRQHSLRVGLVGVGAVADTDRSRDLWRAVSSARGLCPPSCPSRQTCLHHASCSCPLCKFVTGKILLIKQEKMVRQILPSPQWGWVCLGPVPALPSSGCWSSHQGPWNSRAVKTGPHPCKWESKVPLLPDTW